MRVTDPNIKRHFWLRAFAPATAFVLILLGFSLISDEASAIPKNNARIAVDAYTGEVLVARGSKTRWHPASLTKMMTLYQLFDALDRRKVSMRTRIKVSRFASRQPPSKLGIGMGRTISVSHAVQALAIKSANDIAVAVAEHLAGSEKNFAARMTKTARRLGMRDTQFRNASGLHHSGQVTTARDMAILSVALMRDFPQYYKYFGNRQFRYGKRVYRTHNRMLSEYAGMDGLKTGYIYKSGYNLAASVKRGDRRVIAVVLGGNTSQQRTQIMTGVLNEAFKRLDTKNRKRITAKLPISLRELPPLPPPRPGRGPSSILVASSAQKTTAGVLVASAYGTVPPLPLPRPRSQTALSVPISPPAPSALINASATVSPAPRQQALKQNVAVSVPATLNESSSVKAVKAKKNSGRYGVQIGAYRTVSDAERHLASVIGRLPDRLGDPDPKVSLFNHEKRGTYFRARLVGFGTRDEAARTCRWLMDRRTDCLIIASH